MNSLFNHWEKSDQNVMQYICNDVINTELDIKNKKESDDFCGIIVDGRDRNWNTIEDYCTIKSFKLFSERNYPVFVFLHNNVGFLNNEFSLLDQWRITLIEIPKLNNLFEYSKFCIKELYFRIPEEFENILTFQSDGFLYKNGWEKFVLNNNFDLIGSHWFHNASIMFKEDGKYFDFPFQPTNVGNGAFSFRKASKMRKISNMFSKLDLIEKGNPDFKPPLEDLFYFYFGYGSGICKKPTLEQACFFSRDPLDEKTYNKKKSFGFHRPVDENFFCCRVH